MNAIINDILDEWSTKQVEFERLIRMNQLVEYHLKIIDKFEEKLLHIVNQLDYPNSKLQRCEQEVTAMRERIRRKLFRENTASEIIPDDIVDI